MQTFATPIIGKDGQPGTKVTMNFYGASDSGKSFLLNVANGAPNNFLPRYMQVNAEDCIKQVTCGYKTPAGTGQTFYVDPMNNSNRFVQVDGFLNGSITVTFADVDIADNNIFHVGFYDCEMNLSNYSADLSAINSFVQITEAGPFPYVPTNVFSEAQYIYLSAANPTAAAIVYTVHIGPVDYQVCLAVGAAVNNQIFSGGATSTLKVTSVSLSSGLSPPAGSLLRITIGVRTVGSN